MQRPSSLLLGTFLTLVISSDCVSTEQTKRCSSIFLNGTESDTQIQGCTIVEGNVVVNNKANTLTDRSLSALATITEITGFLEITNLGSLTTLPLHGLRLIRGQQTRQNPTLGDSNYSLLIGDASEFVQLPFTQLREISNGDVLLANMKKLCNSDTIDWEDIQNGRQDGLVALLVKSASCQPCNESCGDYCWAPDICQIRSFKACSSACDGRCAHPGVFGCCDSQCAGGCYAARNNSQCVACKSYQSGNECVDQCHPLEIYNHTSFQYVPNPNAQYIHGFQCVSQCPGSMFYDGQICVDSCPVGKYADKNSVCVDCNGICPKDCVGGMLNIGTVGNFTNCTRILTHLKINGTGLTLEDLQTLISVRHIRDYLDITHLPASVTSLSFLGNLEEIAGNNTRNLNSLAVESNEQLKELGLRSLQRIVAGDIYVAFNNQLCVNLTRQNLVAAGVINSDQKVTIFNLMDCSSHPPCHSQCNASLGCWAAEDSQQCLGCQNFDYDGTCVGDCGGGTDRLIFSDLKRKECLPCHEECAVGHGCSGVNPDDCMQCKNVRDGPFCRSRCPPGKYLDSKNNHCQSCHSACNGNCTGSGSHKGQGGCDDCDLFILNDNETSVIECADPTTGCPIHKYEHLIVEPDSHLFILHRVCRECDPQCIACAGPGPTNCCANAIDNGQCVSTCPPNKYQSLNSTCEICPAKCGELGCQLMTNTSPVECNECPYLVNSSGINICVSMCPSDRPIVNASNQVCLNQCDQVIVDINGTKFCSECPDNSFVESDGNNTYCSNCHTECHHVAGKKTCLNGSNHVESCLNGCQNFLQGNYCVQACDSNSVPIGQTGSSSSQLGECVKQLMTTTVSTVTRATIDLMETIMPTATTSQVGDNAQNLDDGSDVTVIIIAAAAGGAVLVLLLLAIICCAYHQRHQKKLNLNTVISNDIAMGTVENGRAGGRKLLFIEEKQLEIGNLSLSSDFGSVYKGTMNQQPYNEKLNVSIRVLNEGTLKASGKKQLDLLASFGHPQIVSLIGLCTTSHVMLVHEFVPLGTLWSFLKSRKSLVFGHNLLSFTKQITEGMSFLEGMNIVHRNLSARSIYVDTPTTVKIGDIALTAIVNVGTPYYKADGPMAPSKWLAPECLQQLQFSQKSDVWAFGVTLWEIMTLGNQPYKDVARSKLLGLLKDGQRLPKPSATSREIYALMLQCWSFLPNNRPEFQQLTEELTFMLQNSTEYVNTLADIEKGNTTTASTTNVYMEVEGDRFENDDDGYDFKAGPTFDPGLSNDWHTATGMYVSPVHYAARDEFGVPVVQGLSPNPMYGDTGTGLGRNDRDRPTLKSRENLLYVSAEDLTSPKSSVSANVIYSETAPTVVYETIGGNI